MGSVFGYENQAGIDLEFYETAEKLSGVVGTLVELAVPRRWQQARQTKIWIT